jgi:hypothetical protein
MLARSLAARCISECRRDTYMSIAETCALYVLPIDEGHDDMHQHQNELNRMQTIFSPSPQTTQPNHNVSLVEFKIRCVESMLETMLQTIRDMKLQLQQTAVHISDLSSVASSSKPTTPNATVARTRHNSI